MMTAAVQKIAVGGFARLVPTEVRLTEPVEIPALCIGPDSECRSLVCSCLPIFQISFFLQLSLLTITLWKIFLSPCVYTSN